MFRFSSIRLRFLTPFLLLIHAAGAHAESNCDASGSPLQCRLNGFLHILDAAAGILAIFLIVVVILAVRYYRRNKNSNGPKS